MAIPQENINEHGLSLLIFFKNFLFKVLDQYDNKNKIKFIGFARVFSGVLRRGMKIFVIGPKAKSQADSSKTQNPINKENVHIQEVTINNIYLFMAQYLEGVQEVRFKNRNKYIYCKNLYRCVLGI